MNKGEQLAKLMGRDDRLHKRYTVLFHLYDRLDNQHPDKDRLYKRMTDTYSLLQQNLKLITDLLNTA